LIDHLIKEFPDLSALNVVRAELLSAKKTAPAVKIENH